MARLTRKERAKQQGPELQAMLVLVSHTDRWMPAVEVAELIGAPWREIAFALRRLVERGQAIERLVEVVGSARTKEQQREYRFAEVESVNPFVPRIVPPRPGVARRVRGRAMEDEEGEEAAVEG